LLVAPAKEEEEEKEEDAKDEEDEAAALHLLLLLLIHGLFSTSLRFWSSISLSAAPPYSDFHLFVLFIF
jgi:hypothetical protein